MHLIHSLGLGYAFLSGKERELGLITAFLLGCGLEAGLYTYISNNHDGFGLSFENG